MKEEAILPNEASFARKKALITGASRGIGKACAYLLAREGYDLYLTCLENRRKLETVQQKVQEAYGIICQIFVCNVGDYEQVQAMFSGIKRLDVLVNNAGAAFRGLLHEMTAEQWQLLMDVNLNSIFYTCRAAVPLMLREQAGQIVNVSSLWGNVGASMEVAYSTAKAGVNGFTRALAKELAPSNIQVNAVAFGFIDTDMNENLQEAEKAALCEEIPAGRAGTPREAAHMVLQVVHSPEYMTGQIITMDGGWY